MPHETLRIPIMAERLSLPQKSHRESSELMRNDKNQIAKNRDEAANQCPRDERSFVLEGPYAKTLEKQVRNERNK